MITHDPLEACPLGHDVNVTGIPATLGVPIQVLGNAPRAMDGPDPAAHAGLADGAAHQPNARMETYVMFAALAVSSVLTVGPWVAVDRLLHRMVF
jgi:hypothetical protein